MQPWILNRKLKLRANSEPTLLPNQNPPLRIESPMYRHLIIFCLVAAAVSFKQQKNKDIFNNLKLGGTFKKNNFHSIYQFINLPTVTKPQRGILQAFGKWMDKHMKRKMTKMVLQQLPVSPDKQRKGSWNFNRKSFMGLIQDERNELKEKGKDRKQIFNQERPNASELKKMFQMEMSWFNRII